MSAPSQFVREAIARKAAAGQCPVCGTKLKKPVLGSDARMFCPRQGDSRHAQPRMTLKKAIRAQKAEREAKKK